MRADDPRLADLSRAVPEMLVAVGFVEETDDHRYANSAALPRGGALVGTARYLPTYGLFDEGRSPAPASGSARTRPVRPSAGSACRSARTSGMPACRCAQALDGADLLVNIAAGPSMAWAAQRAGGDRRLAQDAGHLRAARHRAGRLLQPGRQRGVALTFWGGSRILGPDGSVVAEAPLWRRPSWSARSTPTTRGCSATPAAAGRRAARATRRELDRIIAERAGLPAPDESDDVEMPQPSAASVDARPRTDRAPLPAIEPAQAVEVITGFIRAQLAQTGFGRTCWASRAGSTPRQWLPPRPGGQPGQHPRRANAVPHIVGGFGDRCAPRRRRHRLPHRAGRDHADGRPDAGLHRNRRRWWSTCAAAT